MNLIRKTIKSYIWVLFIIYSGIMLYLLVFGRITATDYSSFSVSKYFSLLGKHFKLIPFRTIKEFIGQLNEFSLDNLAFRNLFGNFILFMPIGFFLPSLFNKTRSFRCFVLTTTIIIMCIELVQGFSLLGVFDVDDLILNTAGASFGFVISVFLIKRTEKTFNSFEQRQRDIHI